MKSINVAFHLFYIATFLGYGITNLGNVNLLKN